MSKSREEFDVDEIFYTHLKRYLERDRIGRLGRLKIALGRIAESEDDELAYAFYAGNSDGSVRLWDAESGTELASFLGHDAVVHTVAFNHDGTLLGSGGRGE